jgi:hypothetical protein
VVKVRACARYIDEILEVILLTMFLWFSLWPGRTDVKNPVSSQEIEPLDQFFRLVLKKQKIPIAKDYTP